MATATNTTIGQILIGGDLDPTSTGELPRLRATGVAPGSYTSSAGVIGGDGTTAVTTPVLAVDTKGRVIYAKSSITSQAIPIASTTVQGVVQPNGTSVTISDGVLSASVASAPKATSTTAGTIKVSNASLYHLVFQTNGTFGLKQATTTDLGKLRPDNTTITIAGDGVISAVPPPTATSTTFGKVRPDGTSISVDSNGVLFTTSPTATGSTLGVVKPDNDSITIAGGVLTAHIARATSSTLGLVQPDNSTVTISGGVLSTVYTNATGSTLGVVKVDGTTMSSSSGIVSAVFPTSTASVSGLVKPDGTSITISGGVISAAAFPTATSSTLGKVRGDNSTITISSGVLSMNSSGIPTATSSVLGKLQIDSASLTSASGVLSLKLASASSFGAIKVPDTYFYQSGGFLKARNILMSSGPNVFTKAQFYTLNGTGTGGINYISSAQALSLNSFYRGTNYWIVSTSNSASIDGFNDTNMYGAQMSFIMSHAVGINLPSFPAVSTSNLGGFKIEGGALTTVSDTQRLVCDMVVIKKDNQPFGLIYNQNVLS